MATALATTLASPVLAGEWVRGGTFDAERGVGIMFLRYLASDGEGQMTIRCDAIDGLWVDAGVTGGGQLPEGMFTGDLSDVEFAFVREDSVDQLTLTGELLIRTDGAVLVTVVGDEATPLADLLLEPAERIDLTVGEVTAVVTLNDFIEEAQNMADRCDGWPATSP